MDRLLFDKYCETWWRGWGVFIADININFPGAALLAQPAFLAALPLTPHQRALEPAQRLVAASGWYSARSAWLDELWQ